MDIFCWRAKKRGIEREIDNKRERERDREWELERREGEREEGRRERDVCSCIVKKVEATYCARLTCLLLYNNNDNRKKTKTLIKNNWEGRKLFADKNKCNYYLFFFLSNFFGHEPLLSQIFAFFVEGWKFRQQTINNRIWSAL